MSSLTDQLTTRQAAVFEFIKDRVQSRGYGPTVREIGEHFQISSPNGVMCHLRALEKKQLLKRVRKHDRAIARAMELAPGSDLGFVLNQDVHILQTAQRGLRQPGLSHLVVSGEECRIVNMQRNLERYLGIAPTELQPLQ